MSVIAQLNRLEHDGLIQVAATQPELAYLFRHGLIKDAAYHSLLKSDRRALHRAVAEALEAPAGGRAAGPRERLPALAHHFGEAGDAERAQHYHTLAGDAAAGLYANAEAIAHYTQALAWAAHTPTTAATLTHLHLALGRAQELSGDYAAAQATYANLETAGRERAEPRLELASLIQQVVVRAVPSPNFNADEAIRMAERGLALARQLGDRTAEARLCWARMLAYNGAGEIASAVQSGEQALALARPLADRELLATILADISRIYIASGVLAQADLALAEALSLWRGLNNVPSLAETLTTLGGLAFFRGRYDEALTHLREGQALSQSINNAWGLAFNLMYQGYVLLDRGDLSASIEALRRCLHFADLGGFVFPQIGVPAALAVAYTYLGQHALAEAALQQGQAAAERYLPSELAGVQLMGAWRRLMLHDDAGAAELVRLARAGFNPNDRLSANHFLLALVEAELSLRQGRPEQALARVRAGLNDHREFGTLTFVSDLYRLEGEALLALDRWDEAEQALRTGLALAAAQPSHRTQGPLCAGLARVAARRGDLAGAAHWQAEAGRRHAYVAGQIDDPEQRAAYLAGAGGWDPTA